MTRLAGINWVLALFCCALALLLWLKPGAQQDYPPLTSLKSEQVNRIRLLHRGNPVLDWSRSDAGWRDAQSGQTPDSKRLAGLLHQAEVPSIYRFPAAEGDLADYGLERPEWLVLLDDKAISFGNLDPITQLRFVQADGQVHLIGDGYFQHVLAP